MADPSAPTPDPAGDDPVDERVERSIAAALTAIDGAPLPSTPGPARRAGWVVRAIRRHERRSA